MGPLDDAVTLALGTVPVVGVTGQLKRSKPV